MLNNNVYVLILFIAVVLSDVPNAEDEKTAKILEYENENIDPRKYYFQFETSNGIYRRESGEFVLSESNEEILVVRGTYSYVDPDNILHIVNYIADNKGYRLLDDKESGVQGAPVFKNRISGNAIKSLQGVELVNGKGILLHLISLSM